MINQKIFLFRLFLLFVVITSVSASNLTNPLAPIPGARVGIGLSYHLGGYTITNRKIPSLMNRYHCRVSYSPITFFNIGLDCGFSQMEVASDSTSQPVVGIFHGNNHFSYGGNIKISTPLIMDFIGLLSIVQATGFKSENKYGSYYKGIDGTGAVGIILHIKNFGYIAAGSKVYYIHGNNRSSNSGIESFYSNINNVRGWFAVDYFPKLEKVISTQLPYFSFEVSIAPDVKFNKRAPIQEISFSISLGLITKRLYGEVSEVEWHP